MISAHDEEGGADERLTEEGVDDSQLKLPGFKWAPGLEVKTGEEEEDVLFTVCVCITRAPAFPARRYSAYA